MLLLLPIVSILHQQMIIHTLITLCVARPTVIRHQRKEYHCGPIESIIMKDASNLIKAYNGAPCTSTAIDLR